MKKKSVLKVFAALCVSSLVMVGCGNKEENEPAAEETVVTEETAPEETEEAENVIEETQEDTKEETVTEEETEEIEEEEEEFVRLTPSEIYGNIKSDVTLNAPMELEAGFIMNLFGIDVSTLDSYMITISESSTSAETIVLLDAKEGADMDALAMAVQNYIDNKGYEMENYLPDQYTLVKNAKVTTEGDFIYAVISENQEAIENIISQGVVK